MSTEIQSNPSNGVELPNIPIRGGKKTDSVLVEGSPTAPDLKDIVDLRNTVDTTVHTETLPSVVHEQVTPTVKHTTKEVIIREIHNYHIFHRIQPIIDVEVLPAKHFIQNPDGTLKEIPASDIPGRPQMWHFAAGPGPTAQAPSAPTLEAASARPSVSISTLVPRSSRGRKPIKQSFHELPSTDGVHRTETTWIHPVDVLPPKWEGDESIFDLADEVDHDRHSSEQRQHSVTPASPVHHTLLEQKPLPMTPVSSVNQVGPQPEMDQHSSSKTSDSVREMKGRAINSLRKMKTKLQESRQEDHSASSYGRQ